MATPRSRKAAPLPSLPTHLTPDPVGDDGVVDLSVVLSPPFRFRLPGSDRVWELPSMRDLPLGIRRRMSDAATPIERARVAGRKPTDAQLRALGQAQIDLLDAVCPDLMDAVPEAALAKLLVQWGQHSGVSLGESQASAR